MQISLGNFGNVVADPQQQVRVPQNNSIAAGLQDVAQAGQQIAGDMLQAEKQKQRTQAVSTLATLTNDYHDVHDSVAQDVMNGKVNPEDAVAEFQKRTGEIKQQRTQGLAPDQMDVINTHLIGISGELERNVRATAIKRTQDDADANMMTAGEQLQRQAMRDLPGSINAWSSMVDAVPYWDATKKEQAKQRFVEGATYNFADATLEGAAQTGKLDVVRAAREKIQGPDGEPIDPQKRIALITKAYGYENGILAANERAAEKAQRDQQARENAAVDIYNKGFDLSSQGRYLSQDFISEMATTAAGTRMAGPVQELVKSQSKVAGFASLPLPQQQAELERMNAAGSDPNIGVNPMEQSVANQFSRIHDESVKAYAENPWQAAQERGVIRDAPVIGMNSIQDAQKIIGQRMQQIGQIEVAAGRKVSPLQPSEAESIGRLVRALPPDQQSSALASFGSMIGDADRVAAFAKQIDAKDKAIGTAMMYANSRTSQGRYTSELVLRGDRALKDGTVKADGAKEVGWRADIAKQIRGAFPNQDVENRMIDAAYYIQAGLKSEGRDDIDNAVRLATGGIVDRNGSKVPLPYGMDEKTFGNRIDAIKPADIASQVPDGKVYSGRTAIPLDQFVKSLPDAALVHAGQGRYNVRAGMGLVTNAQGKRITIEVR